MLIYELLDLFPPELNSSYLTSSKCSSSDSLSKILDSKEKLLLALNSILWKMCMFLNQLLKKTLVEGQEQSVCPEE